jgi:LytS/YehU family sensor histidine kinase
MPGHDGPVNIRVQAAVDGERLVLTVVNDMGPAGPVREDGIGLRNVRERLAAHFGDLGALRTQATAGVWRAEVSLPAVTSR